MNKPSVLAGIESVFVKTPRLCSHTLQCGDESGVPLIFIHGNFSSATYFEELMLAMPETYRCIALDLRGYGLTDDVPIDAHRGARDWSDDLYYLLEALNIPAAHLLGWSAGAAAGMQFLLDHCDRVKSLTLIAPVSPYGFGGSRDLEGTPCHIDFSGSGGGVVAEDFVRAIEKKDRGTNEVLSPLNIIRQSFVNPPFQFEREEQFLSASLLQKIGQQRYPGDHLPTSSWPFTSPGRWGPINAVSGKHLDLSEIASLEKPPPILWIRGDKDSIISDYSYADPAVQGELGHLADWPGRSVYPPQPMVSQTRCVLDSYRDNGGFYREVIMGGVGHSPFLEQPEAFQCHLLEFLERVEDDAGQ